MNRQDIHVVFRQVRIFEQLSTRVCVLVYVLVGRNDDIRNSAVVDKNNAVYVRKQDCSVRFAIVEDIVPSQTSHFLQSVEVGNLHFVNCFVLHVVAQHVRHFILCHSASCRYHHDETCK